MCIILGSCCNITKKVSNCMEIAECNSGINIVGTFMIFHTMACTYFVLASILCVLFLDPVVTLQKKYQIVWKLLNVTLV